MEIASRPDGPSATLLDRELAVAETVWMIGNRMGVDANGNAWPAGVRSMSVADVIVIGETAYKCAHVGWEPISTEDLAWSLDPERQNRNLRLEESRA